MRHVFVTGGTRGIGAAIVRDFISRGYRVTFTWRSRSDLAQELMEQLNQPERLHALPMDLSDRASIRSALDEVQKTGPGVDIVVHNAAQTADGPLFFLEENDWDTVTSISLNSFYYLNKAFLPHMIQNRWGRIIVMASVSGESGQRGQTNYAAAKGALIAASKSLAREVARKGVLVNAVSPGLIETDMSRSVPVAEVLPMIPIGRFGQPMEVAKAVAFLASDDASYINGTVLQVNRGPLHLKNRVAITGVGIMSPLGLSLDELIQGVRSHQSGVRPMAAWAHPELGIKTRVAAPVAAFEEQSIDRKLRRTMSRVALLSMLSTQQALADSDLSELAIKSERTGISFGSSFGGTSTIEEFFQGYQKHGVLSHGIVSTTFLKVMPHTCAANIAIRFGIPGRIVASCVACASSTQAIGYGFEAIQSGLVDRMVCGGAEELTPTVAAIFDVLNATSTAYHDRPSQTPRPFDEKRDGIVVGEGAGTFILENWDQAHARGARIYAEIIGFYTNNDATHMTNPSVEGLVNCMQGALDNAGLTVDAIDYVNAHAAGTAAGDSAELHSIAKVFGRKTPVSSMKGHLGHLMGAAGVVETAACFGMFREQALYPTLNLQSAGVEGEGLQLLQGETRPARVRTILKNSFAFGGVNASLIIQSEKDQ